MNLVNFTFSPDNKIYSLDDNLIEQILLLYNKKIILKLLISNNKMKYYNDLINTSIKYNDFFDNLKIKFNIDNNKSLSIDFEKKQLSVI